MMYSYSDRSKRSLISCHVDLQRLANEIIRYRNIAIICGHRNEEDQNRAYREGKSTKKWPLGKHNKLPSEAFDFVIWPVNWTDYMNWTATGFFIVGLAEGMGIKIRWGADWNRNYITEDETFYDWGHIELIR